jgi:hypothetical protein
MDIVLAIAVMVAAGASLLIAFTLRTWSRAYQERFYDMGGRILDYEKRMVAMEQAISDAQVMIKNLRSKIEAQGNQSEQRSSQDADDA